MAITFLFYTAKKSEAVETGCTNVLGATLFLVVNNISLSTRAIKRVSSASVKDANTNSKPNSAYCNTVPVRIATALLVYSSLQNSTGPRAFM